MPTPKKCTRCKLTRDPHEWEHPDTPMCTICTEIEKSRNPRTCPSCKEPRTKEFWQSRRKYVSDPAQVICSTCILTPPKSAGNFCVVCQTANCFSLWDGTRKVCRGCASLGYHTTGDGFFYNESFSKDPIIFGSDRLEEVKRLSSTYLGFAGPKPQHPPPEIEKPILQIIKEGKPEVKMAATQTCVMCNQFWDRNDQNESTYRFVEALTLCPQCLVTLTTKDLFLDLQVQCPECFGMFPTDQIDHKKGKCFGCEQISAYEESYKESYKEDEALSAEEDQYPLMVCDRCRSTISDPNCYDDSSGLCVNCTIAAQQVLQNLEQKELQERLSAEENSDNRDRVSGDPYRITAKWSAPIASKSMTQSKTPQTSETEVIPPPPQIKTWPVVKKVMKPMINSTSDILSKFENKEAESKGHYGFYGF